MEIKLDNVTRLIEINRSRMELKEEKARLSEPILKDWDKIPAIYEEFARIMEREDITLPTQRKKFLFIILYLCCPNVLAGEKMPVGLRDILADTMSINARSVVSTDCSEVTMYYKHYSSFRNDVQRIFSELSGKFGW